LMHIVGLVWSGGYGVQRKVAGAEQVLRSPGEVAGMGLMGLGGRSPSSAACCSWSSSGAMPCARGRAGRLDDPPAVLAATRVHARRVAVQPRLRRPLNPLYHLGAISFYLFWIVGGTGLVLYAFFDTSVVRRLRSVEALTASSWLIGGMLRSVHRYASDAMVLTMLLHLLRYFAFDRMRGFRWFSWVTGVVLLWMVYAAGANGYMLPWDRWRSSSRRPASSGWTGCRSSAARWSATSSWMPTCQRSAVLAAGLHPHRRAAGDCCCCGCTCSGCRRRRPSRRAPSPSAPR
jgi:hypothetical protein